MTDFLFGLNSQLLALKRKHEVAWNAIVGGVFLILVFAGGIIGYMWIEAWSVLDSFYMVVITLATVGYQEVQPLSPAGRVFTSIYILVGVSGFLYLTAAFAQLLVEGRFQMILGRRKMLKEIQSLRNHFIICGYGRIGSIVAREIRSEGHVAVVIEMNPEFIAKMEDEGILCLEGDATDDELLMQAGLLHARSLITALTDEAANVYVTLTARQLNPDLNIIARANREAHITRLQLAGADRVVLPHMIGGIRMAQSVLRPTVTNFMELAVQSKIDLQMEELVVSPTSELVNKDLIASEIRPRFNLIIIAIKKEDEHMVFNPGPKEMIEANDTLIAVGNLDDLQAITAIL
ncbi:MAG: potassium channel family protein [Desulfovibrio sp.]